MRRTLGKLKGFLSLSFIIALPLSLILYILRGLGFLGFLSGGVILICFLIAIFSAISLLLVKTYI